MKTLLLAFTMVLLDVAGCGSRHHDDLYLDVSPKEVVLTNEKGATGELRVFSNGYWILSVDKAQWQKFGQWLDVAPMSGTGDATITVVSRYPLESGVSRECLLTINGEGGRQQVTVIQHR